MRVMFIKKKAILVVSVFVAMCLVMLTLIINNTSDSLQAAAETEDAIALPIIMYHSVVEKHIDFGTYVISPEIFEEDMRYLQENGYTSVSISDLVAYTTMGLPLPDKPVLISFDDGHLNNLSYCLPILQEYEMKAVVSVVGEYIERAIAEGDPNPDYSYLTWDDISELVASGNVEIGNHSSSMHSHGARDGALPVDAETTQQYQQMLTDDLQKLQNDLFSNCGIKPLVFAYPFGLVDKSSFDVVKNIGLKASFSCYEGMNYISKDPDCLFCLKRYNRPYGISTDAFMQKILEE